MSLASPNLVKISYSTCEIAFRLKAFIVQEKVTVAAALFIIVPSSVVSNLYA